MATPSAMCPYQPPSGTASEHRALAVSATADGARLLGRNPSTSFGGRVQMGSPDRSGEGDVEDVSFLTPSAYEGPVTTGSRFASE